jgi:hypothetical protein
VTGDIRRVAFVTSRFHEMRGLIPATFGAGLVLSVLASADGSVLRPTLSLMFVPLLTAHSVHMLAGFALDRGYRSTFGDVVAAPRQRVAAGLLPFLLLVAGLFDATRSPSASAPNAMPTLFAAYSLWIVARDWPWRAHYLGAAAAGVAAMIITALAPADGRMDAWMTATTLTGLGLVGVGLRDHHLLTMTMRAGAPPVRPASFISRPWDHSLVALLMIASGAWMNTSAGQAASALYVIVLLLILAIWTVVFVDPAVRATLEFTRRNGRVTPQTGPFVHLAPGMLTAMFAVAVAAALEPALRVTSLAVFTAAAVALVNAVTRRPDRPRTLAIAALFLAFGLAGRYTPPTNAIGLLLVTAGLVLLVHTATTRVPRAAP